MANIFHTKTHAKIQTLVDAITTALNGVSSLANLDFSFSPGFRLVIEVGQDGRTVTLTTQPSDQGPNNAFGALVNGHRERVPALVFDATQL